MKRMLQKSSSSLKLLAGSVAAVAMLAAWSVPVEAAPENGGRQAHGSVNAKGQQGSGEVRGGRSLNSIFRDLTGASEDDSDSDAPPWAGQPGGKSGMGGGQPTTAGVKRGDLFGDMWVIDRDDDGVPILTTDGFVQPLDADGNPIPLDDEGKPLDPSLTIEVDIGRLNVGRAPSKVLDRRAEEVVKLLDEATDLALDPAGRLEITTIGDDGLPITKTIDSPLENLAIYVALLTEGSIPGISDLPGEDFDFMVDNQYTIDDLEMAASLIAAANDKTTPFTSDEIAYINAFLDINLAKVGDVTYSDVEYTDFEYSRVDTFGNVEAEVLVQQVDGSWAPETVSIYQTVFGGVDLEDSGSLDAFTAAAEDSRLVIEFIHEYAVPVDQMVAN